MEGVNRDLVGAPEDRRRGDLQGRQGDLGAAQTAAPWAALASLGDIPVAPSRPRTTPHPVP